MIQQLIRDEKFTNIQRAQAGLTKLFEDAQKTGSFYRVMKNDTPMGVLIPNEMWEDFLEDLEAMTSPNYLSRIKKARTGKKTYTMDEAKKQLGIS